MRILDKSLHHYPLILRPFFWYQIRKYGETLKPALLWARIPLLFTTVALLCGVLDRKKSPLTRYYDPLLLSEYPRSTGAAFVSISIPPHSQRAQAP